MKPGMFKVGQTIIVNGNGVFGGEGIPKASDGMKAEITKVGRTKLTVLIKGEIFSRHIHMANDVRRIVKK